MATKAQSVRHTRLNLRRLGLFVSIAVVSWCFWLTPALTPLKIFVVFIHEASHALATVLTGGRVVSMVVTPWESGYVQSVGGSPLLIASAGYVGSALFGGVMLLCAGRQRWATTIICWPGVVVWRGHRVVRAPPVWHGLWSGHHRRV